MSVAPDPEMLAFAREAALADAGETGIWTSLSGGVSSDIWKLQSRRGAACLKRALPTLKVAENWNAPVGRNASEWSYLVLADRIAPGGVPRPLAHDKNRGIFAMAWLDPTDHPVWKDELLAGRRRADDAAAVGRLLGTLHATTADDHEIATAFDNTCDFEALRLDPYFRAAGRRHPDLAPALNALADRTAGVRRVLVHGDISPKNILLGPERPVLLDAECAWFGDPAFDVAFLLNHLLIKRRIAGSPGALDAAAAAFLDAYRACVTWEASSSLEARAAPLLAALALARVDGKSPVEYLDADQRSSLRAAARAAVEEDSGNLARTYGILTGAGEVNALGSKNSRSA